MKKILILITAVFLAFGFFALDLNQYLTLDEMKTSLGHFEAQRASSPVGVGLALFGLSVGTVFVPFASILGAAWAFLASRYVQLSFALLGVFPHAG